MYENIGIDAARLNPYYTGIHLHAIPSRATGKVTNVLILIILEYIYITKSRNLSPPPKCLNPYYTGIHLHVIWERLLEVPASVLILIILEYIYIAL